MARISALLQDIACIAMAAIDRFGSLEWLLAAIFVSFAAPMLAQIAIVAWTGGKKCARRFLAYICRELFEWVADRVFAWIMAALVALVTLWSSGFWG